MSIAFDLISDLHVETWKETFDWSGQATSPICVVAGDISTDPAVVKETLKHLSKEYAAVFYIDGNEEHKNKLDNLGASYKDLSRAISRIKRTTFLQDNVIVFDGIALVGTNGWWGFDLDSRIGVDESKHAMQQRYSHYNPGLIIDSDAIQTCAKTDAAYLINTVQRLQTHKDVKKIVIVTHTVPGADLIEHDISLYGTPRFNTMGNKMVRLVSDVDLENKIHTWCFGHYHRPVDRLIDGVRYVNNCRGRRDTPYYQHAYYPKRIVIDL